MQFKVPQFLDIEDKLFGPFTFREFAYLAGGAGLCFMLYRLLGLLFGAIPILIMGGFSLMLTFYRPNNKPFIDMLGAGFKYLTQHKLYIWKKNKTGIDTVKQLESKDQEKIRRLSEGGMRLSGSKLRDLAWSLDVLELNKKPERQL